MLKYVRSSLFFCKKQDLDKIMSDQIRESHKNTSLDGFGSERLVATHILNWDTVTQSFTFTVTTLCIQFHAYQYMLNGIVLRDESFFEGPKIRNILN